MTLTLDIPAELEEAVSAIPGIRTRVALYLRHEAQLEQARQQRHSDKARAIAERALIGAQQDQNAGFDWKASFAELEQRHQEITSKL
ncbi:MAG: hypothetical protein JWR15_3257 [Prosthecobacter sp.]|nr:hypothetical protein [Prosthecobacter sp.]